MNVLLLSMPDSFEHMPPIVVRMPNGATYSGPPHRVPDHGAVAASWRTSDINPPGEYTVSAIADSGETAEATFRLTPPGG